MKYVIFILGVLIILARTAGVEIDLTSIGLFVFISIIASIKDFSKLTEFSGFGLNFKFNKELEQLSEDAGKINKELTALKSKEKGLSGIESQSEGMFNRTTEGLEEINIEINQKDPTLTLLLVAIEIEKTLRAISEKELTKENSYPTSPKRIVHDLIANNLISPEIGALFEKFWMLRNQLVHGVNHSLNKKQVLSLIDSGIQILNILKLTKNNLEKGLKIYLHS